MRKPNWRNRFRARIAQIANETQQKPKSRSAIRKLLVEQLEDRRVLATAIVTTNVDNNDSGIAVGGTYTIDWLNTHKGTDGKISLREAIIAANNTSGLDSISFGISSTTGGYMDEEGNMVGGTPAPTTISIGSTGLGALPAISSPITISGYTQLGSSQNTNTTYSNAQIMVILDGLSAGTGAVGLSLAAGSAGSTVRGLAIQRFSGSGVSVASDINVIAGNFIGLDSTGASAMANGTGITVTGGSYNVIGGTTAADRNVISSNTNFGILLQTSSNSNTITGNLMGLSASGSTTRANGTGISIVNSNANTIGGTSTSNLNIITGSTNEGVLVSGTSNNNAIEGNSIYGNTKLGINLAVSGDPASGVTTNDGAKTTGAPNLAMDKPAINTATLSSGILTMNGYVGMSPGSSAFASSRVEFFVNASGATNGSGKTYLGYLTSDSSGAFSGTLNVAAFNLAGTEQITATATDSNGNTSEFAVPVTISQPVTFAVYPDQATSVEAGGVNNGTAGTNPTGNISSNDIGSGNTIIGVQPGTLSSASGGVGTSVSGTYGTINVSSTGAFTYTLNNSNSSVQALKNTSTTLSDIFTYTSRSSAMATASTQITITIQGANDAPTITSNGGGSSASISVYENTTAVTTVIGSDIDASTTLTYSISGGADAGKFTINSSGVLTFVTAPDYENPTDVGANNIYDLIVQVSDGSLSITQTLSVGVIDVADQLVVTTATDNNDAGIQVGATYNTSWLNANKGADGQVSLREAIIAANNTAGLETISFNIPGTGIQTINVGATGLGSLPSLIGPIDLNGYSQPGSAVANTSTAPTIKIALNGSSAGASANGLLLSTGSSGTIIHGLSIGNFSGSGIQLASSNNYVLGNIIGYNATWTTATANGKGVYVNNVSGNSIGGVSISARNWIAGNTGDGVNIAGTAASGNLVEGNSIYANGQLGINLVAPSDTGSGATANDGAKTTGQPNLLMDSAVITSANLSGNSLSVAGWVGSAANQSTFANSRVEFFVNETGTTKNTGKTYIGTLTSDANGNFSGSLNVAGITFLATDKLTATATDTSNNTSEFGTAFDLNIAPTLAADTGIALEAGGVNNSTAGTNATGNVLTNDSDQDAGDTLTVNGLSAGVVPTPAALTGSAVTGSYGSLTLNASGSFTYVVNNSNAAVNALRTTSDTLTDTFTYSVRDAMNAVSTAQITVTIQGADDAPTISAISNQTIQEDSQLGPVSFTVSDPDTTLSTLTLSGTGSNTSLVPNSAFTFSGTDTNRTVTVSPTANANGSVVLTLRVADAAGYAESSFTLTIGSVNDAPVLDNSVELQLTPLTQFDPSDMGTRVSDILSSMGTTPISDADAGASQGIAVWNAPSIDGQWQYSLDNGVWWTTMSVVSTSSALLLKPTDRIRYMPFIETSDVYAMSFYAWDQSASQTNGVKVNATTRGGISQFSTASATAKINVSNLQSRFIDDGEVGFATTDIWTTVGTGRQFDARTAPAASNATATWTFPVAKGVYNIAANWLPAADATTNAQFQVGLASVTVDQTAAPQDFTAAGVKWKRLMTVVSDGSPIVVTLKGQPNAIGNLIADSVRIEATSSLRAAEFNDSLSSASGVDLFPGIPINISNYIGDGNNLNKDVDIYSVSLAASQKIQIDVDALSREFNNDPSDLISRIRVFNAAGTELATAAGSAAADPSLEFVAPSAGSYYIGIASVENNAYSPLASNSTAVNATTGSYLLRVLSPQIAPSSTFDHTYTVGTNYETTDLVHLSLRSAIAAANSAGGRSLILFGDGINAIQPHDGLFNINSDITLRGPSTGTAVTISPAVDSVTGSLFQVNASGSLRLENIILSGAHSTSNGASIKVDGSLAMDHSEIRNSTSADGGAVYISSTGSVQMMNSTIADSTAARGGAVYVQSGGKLTAINSTFAHNDATTAGDAIVNGGTTSLFSSTVARNGLSNSNLTETLQNLSEGRFILHDTLVSDNINASDTSGSFTSHGYNLIGKAGTAYGLQSASALHDQIGGQYGAPVLSNVVGELYVQGGQIRTMQLNPTSPAIDAGSSYGRGDFDARGADRKLDGPEAANWNDFTQQSDLGATEFGTYFVDTAQDLVDAGGSPNDGVADADSLTLGIQTTLRSAMRELSGIAGWNGESTSSTLNRFEGVVRFAPAIQELVLKRQGADENQSLTGDLDVWGNIRIIGTHSPSNVLLTSNWMVGSDGNSGAPPQYFQLNDRAFQVLPGAKLELDDLRINGFHSEKTMVSESGNGGTVLNDGELVMRGLDVTFPYLHQSLYSGKLAAENGGAIYSRGNVTITGSSFNKVSAKNGGTIYMESGSLVLDQGALIKDSYASQSGGAIFAAGGKVQVEGASTIRENVAAQLGGSLYIAPAATAVVEGGSHLDANTNRTVLTADGVAVYNMGNFTMRDGTTLSNHSMFGGSTIYNLGTADLDNIVIADNGHTVSSSIIRNVGRAHLTLTNSLFRGNGSPYSDPGAILNDDGWMWIDNVHFTENLNSSAEAGLVANVGINANLTIHGSRFDYNVPTIESGAPLVFNKSGTLTVDSNTFEYNGGRAGFYATSTVAKNLAVNEKIENAEASFVTLAAQIEPNQNTVFLNDVSSLRRYPLPFDLLIGEEMLRVTSIDDFRTAVKVTRTKSVTHTVDEEVRTFVNEAQDYLLAGDPDKYKRYNIPFDILVDNEVMTVSAIDDQTNLLSVVRGRNGTIAAQHNYPFQIWAVSGGMTVINNLIADNHAQGELWPSGSEMIFNWVHPYAPPTILESNTFYNNSRYPAEKYTTNNENDSTTGQIYENTGDVRTFRGPYESLPTFNRGSFPQSAHDSDKVWKDPTASMVIENNVFANQHSLQGKQPPAVRGNFKSAGGNFVDEAEVSQYFVRNELTNTSTTLFIEQPKELDIPTPYLAQIGHVEDGSWKYEYVMVTESIQVEAGEHKLGRQLTIQRGAANSNAIFHPFGATIAWSKGGFWEESDRFGLPIYDAYQNEQIHVHQSVGVTDTIVFVDDATGLPNVPFNASIIEKMGDASTYDPSLESVTPPKREDVIVTAVNGNQLTVQRGKNGTDPNTFPADSYFLYFNAVETAIDAKLTRYFPAGETYSIVTPLPDSPLLNKATPDGFTGHYATINSNLGANNFLAKTTVLMSVDPAHHTVSTNVIAYSNEKLLAVDDVTHLPQVPFVIKYENELMTAIAVNTAAKKITVVRGAYHTSKGDIPIGSKLTFGRIVSSDANDHFLLVDNALNLPPTPFTIKDNGEMMIVNSVDKASNILNVSRASRNSLAVVHEPNTVFAGDSTESAIPELNFESMGTADTKIVPIHASGSLGRSIDVSQTTITFLSLPIPMTSIIGGRIKIGDEEMLVSEVSLPTNEQREYQLTVVRGYRNTTPTATSQNSSVTFYGFAITTDANFSLSSPIEYFRIREMVWPVDPFGVVQSLADAGLSADDPLLNNRKLIPVDQSRYSSFAASARLPFDMQDAVNKNQTLIGVFGRDISASSGPEIDINLTYTDSLPNVPFKLQFGKERFWVTEVNPATDSVTATRAFEGTVRQFHTFREKPDQTDSNIGTNNYVIATTAVMSVSSTPFTSRTVEFTFLDETVIKLENVAVVPSLPCIMRIGNEFADVVSVDTVNSTVTVVRGQHGTVNHDIKRSTVVQFGKPISALVSDNRFLVDDASILPPAPFYLLHGTEMLRVDNVDVLANAITITRAMFDTEPTEHKLLSKFQSGFDDVAHLQSNYEYKGDADIAFEDLFFRVKLIKNMDAETTHVYIGDLPVPPRTVLNTVLKIDDELMAVLGVNYPSINNPGFYLTVKRAIGDTVADAHNKDSDVHMNGIGATAPAGFQPNGQLRYLRIDDFLWRSYVPLDKNLSQGNPASAYTFEGQTLNNPRKFVYIYDWGDTNSISLTRKQFNFQKANNEGKHFAATYGQDLSNNTPDSIQLNVPHVAYLPEVPFLIQFNEERMKVTAVDPVRQNVTITRAFQGTAKTSLTAQDKPVAGTFVTVTPDSQLPDKVPFVAQIGNETIVVNHVDPEYHLLTVARAIRHDIPAVQRIGQPFIWGNEPETPGYNAMTVVLRNPLSTSDTTMTVWSAFPLPNVLLAQIESERIQAKVVTRNADGTTVLNIVRGIGTTNPASHVQGANVLMLADYVGGFRDVNGVDIGSLESVMINVNTTLDLHENFAGDGVVETSISGAVSLRAAIEEANASPGIAVIRLPAGTYHVPSELLIDSTIEIIGESVDNTTLIADNSRLFHIGTEGKLRLANLVVKGTSTAVGGAIWVDGGALETQKVWIKESSGSNGGAIASVSGKVTIANSTLSASQATGRGGAIHAVGSTVKIEGTTISGNSAGVNGGAIWTDANSSLTVRSSTITLNNATGSGGIVSESLNNQIGASIIAQNSAIASIKSDLTGAFTTLGSNLIGIGPIPTRSLAAPAPGTGPGFVPTIVVDAIPANMPTVPFPILVEQEFMLVTEVAGTTWTVTRGYNSTSMVAHPSGTLIRMDNIWLHNDQMGTVTQPINPYLAPLTVTTSGTVPVHPLLSNSPALNAVNGTQWNSLPKTHAVGVSEYLLEFVRPETLPPAPFVIMTQNEVRTVLELNGARGLLNEPFIVPASEFDIAILTDSRNAPRIFSVNNSEDFRDGNLSTPSNELSIAGMDIGAYEAVPVLTLTADKTSGTELSTGLNYFTYTITRSVVTSGSLTVDYVIDGSGEHAASASDFANGVLPYGSVTFAPGQTSVTVQIGVQDDPTLEHREQFVFRILSPMDALIPTREIAGNILPDNDSISFTMTHTSSADEGDGFAYDVTLHGSIEGGIFLAQNYTAGGTNAADFEGVSEVNHLDGPLYFSGVDSETRSFAILTHQDFDHESNESFVVSFQEFLADLTSKITLPPSATSTIIDNDPPNITPIKVSVKDAEMKETGTQHDFEIQVDGILTAPLILQFETVPLSAKPLKNYAPLVQTITFMPNQATSAHVFVGLNDIPGPNQSLVYQLKPTLIQANNQNVALDPGLGSIYDVDKLPPPLRRVCVPRPGHEAINPVSTGSTSKITGYWPPVITPTSTWHTYESNLYLSQYNYNVQLQAGWTEVTISVQPMRYIQEHADPDIRCDKDDEKAEPPTDLKLEYIDSEWVVPHSDSITLDPFVGFNYRLAPDAILVAEGIKPGQSKSLKYGMLTVNADNTFTYEPNDLKLSPVLNDLLPELDAFGNVIRFANRETFYAHLVPLAEISRYGSSSSSDTAPIEYASVPIELTIANNLPAMVGSSFHDLGEDHTMELPGTIYLDAQPLNADELSYRIDLKDIFEDEGDDLKLLKIVDIMHGNESLDSSREPSEEDAGFDDPHKNDIRVPVMEKENSSGTVERDMIVTRLNDHAMNIYNETRIMDIQSGTWTPVASVVNFKLIVTDGSMERYIDTDEDGVKSIKWQQHEWEVDFAVRPNNMVLTNSLWRHGLGVPEQELRPWITTELAELDATQNVLDSAVNHSLTTFTSNDVRFKNVTSIGGMNIDLFTGDLNYTQPLLLDTSGGNASYSVSGLTFDSSLIQDFGGPTPVIYGVIDGPSPTSISAKLNWYDNLYDGLVVSTIGSIGSSGSNQTVIAIRPPIVPTVSGIYGWQLELTINGDEFLRTSGELPIIVGDLNGSNPYANPFGAGWALSGVPEFIFDGRGTNQTEDDRIVIHFPGDGYKIFDANSVSAGNWNFSGELSSLMQGASVFGTDDEDQQRQPIEFGTLKADGSVLTYRDADGTEYVANKVQLNGKTRLLLDRIEPPGSKYIGGTWVGAHGVNFTWSTGGSHPVIMSMKASDDSTTNFDYDANLMIDKIIVGPVISPLRTYDLTTTTGSKWTQLTQIEELNAIVPGLSNRPVPSGVMNFEYDAQGFLESTDWSGNDSPKVTITYSDASHFDSQIQVGTLDGYQIKPAGNIPATASKKLVDLKATVTQNVTNLKKYNPADAPTELVGTSSIGESKETFEFDKRGQKTRDLLEFDNKKISDYRWQYNLVGDVEIEKQWVPGINVFRETFYVYDYQIKPRFKTKEEDTPSNKSPKYDPTDYRGNVVHVISTAGHSYFQYDTDNENGDARGALLRSTQSAKVDSDGNPQRGGPSQEIITEYEWSNERTLMTKTAKRTKGGSAIEKWTYDSQARIASYTDPQGLLTQYLTYDHEQPTLIQAEDLRTVLVYDERGYPKQVTSSSNSIQLSEKTQVYDVRGFLREDKLVDGKNSILSYSQFDYSGAGNIVLSADAQGTRTQRSYNTNGLLDKQSSVEKGKLGETATPLTYRNQFLNNNDFVVQSKLAFTYFSNGSPYQVIDEVNNDKVISAYFYEPGASMFTASNSGYNGLRTWVATPNVAGPTDAAGMPTSNAVDVAVTETDGIGRVHRTDDLLQGGQKSYLYGDIRIDKPTKITQNQSAQGAPLITLYRYDSAGDVLFEKVGETAAKQTAYDELGIAISSAVLATFGGIYEFETTPTGLVTKSTEIRKNTAGSTKYAVTRNEFDKQGRLVVSRDPLAGSERGTSASRIKYNYESGSGSLVTTTTDRVGTVTSTKSDALGRVVMSINAQGGETTIEYDSLGNQVKQTVDGDTPGAQASITTWEYDAFGRNRKQTTGGLSSFTDYFDVKSSTGANWSIISTNQSGTITALKNDSLGNPLMQAGPAGLGMQTANNTNPDSSQITTFGYQWNYASDSVEVTTMNTVTGPVSAIMPVPNLNYEYLVRSKQTKSISGVSLNTEIASGPGSVFFPKESVTYDTAGRSLTVNADGVLSTYAYDDDLTGLGVVSFTRKPGAEDSVFYFDSAGNKTKLLTGPDVVRWSYDELGRMLTETIYPNGPDERKWEYAGKKTTYTNRNDWVTTTIVSPSTGETNTVAVRPSGSGTSGSPLKSTFSTYKTGQLKSASNSIGNDKVSKYDMQYDQLGRLSNQVIDLGALSDKYELDYQPGTYNSNGADRTATRTVSVGASTKLTTTTVFDKFDRVKKITSTPGENTGLHANHVDLIYSGDFLSEIHRSSGTTAGPTTTFTPQLVGGIKQVSTLTHTPEAANDIFTQAIHYDNGDRLLDVVTTVKGIPQGTKEYIRNDKMEIVGIKQGPDVVENFKYDLNQNRLGAVGKYSRLNWDANNAYKYDDEGNVIERAEYASRIESGPLAYNLLTDYSGAHVESSYKSVGAGAYRIRVSPIELELETAFEVQYVNVTARLKYDDATSPISDTVVAGTEKTIKARMLKIGPKSYYWIGETWEVNIDLDHTANSYYLQMEISFSNATGPAYELPAGYSISGQISLEQTQSVWFSDFDNNNRLVRNVERIVQNVPSTPASGGQAAVPAQVIFPTRSGNGEKRREFRYTYDVFGNRIGLELDKPDNGSLITTKEAYLFENGEVLLKFQSEGSSMVLSQERVFNSSTGDEFAIDDKSFTGPIWVLSDYQKSARVLYVSNTNQSILKYDAYGSVTLAEGSALLHKAASLGYMGMEYSVESKLYWDDSRYYDPVAGRYTTEHTSGYIDGNTNLYVFANNTPADRVGKSDVGAVNAWTYYRGTARTVGAIQAAFGLFTAVTSAMACPVTWGATCFVAVVGADQGVAGLRTLFTGEFTDSFMKSSTATYARSMGASEQTAEYIGTGVDLVTGLGAGFLDDAIKSGAKYGAAELARGGGAIAEKSAKQLALLHASKRLGYQAGGAGAGFLIGGFAKGDGSFDIDNALAGAGYGSAAGGLVGAYRVKCFAAGEHVWTKDGSQPIETLKVGDWVVSRNEHDVEGPLQLKRIEEVFCNDGEVFLLRVHNATIRTTAEHPFYSKERGWTAASDLEEGEWIATADGQWAEVESTQATSEVTELYNFRISDFHTYFVGEREKGIGIWAHNSYDPPRSGGSWSHINRVANEYDDFINVKFYGGVPASKPHFRTSQGARFLDNVIEDGLEIVGVENKYFRQIDGIVDTGVVRGTAKRAKLAETLQRIRKQARKDQELLLSPDANTPTRIDWNLNAQYPKLEKWLKSLGMNVQVRPKG